MDTSLGAYSCQFAQGRFHRNFNVGITQFSCKIQVCFKKDLRDLEASGIFRYAVLSSYANASNYCKRDRVMILGRRFRSGILGASSVLMDSCSQWRVFCSNKGLSIPFTEEWQTRASADEVRREILKCYELVHKLGKGVVYLGSSRTSPDHPHFLLAKELGREVATLLNCTSWTGVGPGMMDAAIKGALQAKKPVGGFKISKEVGEWTNSNVHPYLEDNLYLTCRFFSARKHGLVDAAMRNFVSDRTAFIALPGGIGTLDEIFEILTLIQLERIGSKFPVPFLLMNYDGFYSRLLDFLETCKLWGTVGDGEVEALWKVCSSNEEAMEHLANFYCIAEEDRKFRGTIKKSWLLNSA